MTLHHIPIETLVADPPWRFADNLPGDGRGSAKHYGTLTVPEIMRFPLPELAKDARLFLWRVASQQEEALDVMRAWGFTPKAEIVWVKADTSSLLTGDTLDERRRALRFTVANLAAFGGVDVRETRAVLAGRSFVGDALSIARVETALATLERDALALTPRVRIGMGRQVRNAHEVCLIGVRGRPAQLDKGVPSVIFAPRQEHSTKPEEFYRHVERLSPGPFAELFARRERAGWECYGDELARAYPGAPLIADHAAPDEAFEQMVAKQTDAVRGTLA